MSKLFNKQNFEYGKQIASGIGQAINKVKTKINKTKLEKIKSRNTIAETKAKASKAKLDQTVLKMKIKCLLLLKVIKENQNQIQNHIKEYKKIILK
jgi:hypothetical protein